ncbi:MAG: hypothetical protein K2J51_05035, partial [Alistipes sp.]|nr:hypothetical protein [Alistipes sp.]
MNTGTSHFKILAVVMAALAATLTGAAAERTDVSGGERRLDCREHRGYEGWERIIPTHAKVQYAGGMGLLSAGCGWDYGRKSRWETDVMVGFLPKSCTARTAHATFTLRQSYIPWSIRCSEHWAIEPFTCGVYLNVISGEEYWMHEPAKYPGKSYYGFPTRIFAYLCVGQRMTLCTPRSGILRNITLYYELGAHHFDIIAKAT